MLPSCYFCLKHIIQKKRHYNTLLNSGQHVLLKTPFPPKSKSSPSKKKTGLFSSTEQRPPRLHSGHGLATGLRSLRSGWGQDRTDQRVGWGVIKGLPVGFVCFFFGLVVIRGWKTNPCRMLFWDNFISSWHLMKLWGWTYIPTRMNHGMSRGLWSLYESLQIFLQNCNRWVSRYWKKNSIFFLQSHLDACWTWSLILEWHAILIFGPLTL